MYLKLNDLHSITNEIYLSYFTFDSLKYILPYHFYLVERFLKLSSNFIWATPDMSCDVNLLNPGARNFAHYTVLNTWYSDLLLPGIIGQLFAKVWVIYVTT